MMRIGKILIRLEKLKVDYVQDEQDFRLEDEVTEDSTEYIDDENSEKFNKARKSHS